MSPDTAIRTARPCDAELLSTLAMASKSYWGYPEEFMAACRAELTCTREDLQDGKCRFFVAERDGQVIGFYGLEMLTESVQELAALFVAPEYIGKGAGRLLIEHAQRTAMALGATAIMIQGDPNAERFYLAVGAQRAGESESKSVRGRYLPRFKLCLSAASA